MEQVKLAYVDVFQVKRFSWLEHLRKHLEPPRRVGQEIKKKKDCLGIESPMRTNDKSLKQY